ncbi:MAG: NERD domain-containing protein [Clostridia bacterium]|nr:NERD domain-containing protein [Clostridia bacterium]
MARIIKKDDSLDREYKNFNSKKRNKIYTAIILFLIASVGAYLIKALELSEFFIIPTVILYIAAFACFIVASFFGSEEEKIFSGLDGEQAAAELLSCLPEDFVCFQNVIVEIEEKKSEIDLIVVGRTGLFIVEIKNMTGFIQGNMEDKKWIQTNVGRRGGEYSREFYSPVKQVKTHVYRLREFLKSKKINVYIEPLVYFASDETPAQIKGEEVPVFSAYSGDKQKLIDFIMNRENKLSDDRINAIKNAIDTL